MTSSSFRHRCSIASITVRIITPASLISLGRTNASAPTSSAAFRMSSSPAETTIRSSPLTRMAVAMVQWIKGFPPRGRMFLNGIPVDPERAGIRAMVLTAYPPGSV